MKPARLPFSLILPAFIGGFAVMGIEILASRLVAPAFGTSVLVWTNLIGIILLAMALGAFLGGRLADRRPEPRMLGALLIAAGALTSILSALTFSAAWVGHILPESFALPIVAILFLGPPTLVLAAIQPMTIRLALQNVGEAGQTAGRLSVAATFGSLLGTYLTGYILLAHYSTDWILSALTIVLYVTGILALRPRGKTFATCMMLGASTIAVGQTSPLHLTGTTIPSAYSAMRLTTIRFENQPTNVLWMDDTAHAGSTIDKPGSTVFLYDKIMSELPDVLAPNAKTLLAIGGGAFHAPRAWLADRTDRHALAIERDPAAIEASRQFFALKDDPRLKIIEGDGRTSLHGRADTFDVILVDAFINKRAIPWHLVTKEAWAELRAHMTEGTIVVMNTIVSKQSDNLQSRKLIAGIVNATGDQFSWHKLLRTSDQSNTSDQTNAILIMGNGTEPSDKNLSDLLARHPDASLTDLLIPIDLTAEPAFTDQFAPVEYLSEPG